MAWYKLDEEGNIEGLLKPLAPLINYVARLNGTDQYWQLSEEINTGPNFDFSISTQIETSGPSMITGANNSSAGCFFHSNGKFIVRDTNSVSYTTVTIFPIGDGSIFDTRVLVVNGDLSLYVDGVLQVMDRANDGTFSGLFLHRIGRRTEAAFYNKGITYGFLLKDVSGTVLNQIPLTNKAQGATQLATVGSVNATMVNYDESVWEVLPEPEPINYVARLNGTDQYWELSNPIIAQDGEDFKLKISSLRVDPSGGRFIFSSMLGSDYGINLYASGDYSSGQGSLTVFGGVGLPFIDNLSSDTLLDIELNRIGAVWTLSVNGLSSSSTPTSEPPAVNSSTDTNIFRRVAGGFILGGYSKDFEFYINDVLVNKIPLTNKAQGATQLATVGSVNATMVGYTPDVWGQV